MIEPARVLTESDSDFGVYIHWPFCAQKCPYCDFNSHVRFGGWDEARFLSAYKRELDFVAGMITTSPNPSPQGGGGLTRTVSSIFFGGGTPSLMKPETVASILDHIAKLWTIDRKAEITLEANPGSVEAARFKGYRAAGVNRVSMGLQSLRDEELKKLGRIHTVEEAKAALKIASDTFERFSFDLIYARPGQTADAWRTELVEALDLAGDHISLYQLTIEPDTPYAALAAAGKLVIPDDDAARAVYEITQEMTAARGLPAYEISNHARPGEESRHNLLYWRYGEYVGVGPGAHGRLMVTGNEFPPSPLEGEGWGGRAQIQRYHTPHRRYAPPPPQGGRETRIATVAEKNPERWCELAEQHGHGFIEQTELAPSEQADEMLLMGLRLREGVDLDRLAAIGGVAPSAKVIADLRALGLVETEWTDAAAVSPPAADWRANELETIPLCAGPGLPPETSHIAPAAHRIRATPQGRFVLNAVVAELSKSFAPSSGRQPGHMDKPANAQ